MPLIAKINHCNTIASRVKSSEGSRNQHMKHTMKTILAVLLSAAAFCGIFSDVARGQTSPTTAPATQPAFPQSWIGRWKGSATVDSVDGKDLAFEMQLNIAITDAPDRFTWEVIYTMDGKPQVRPYELVVIDAAKGKYLIDEKSSIKIDSQLLGDTLYSQFRVQSALISASYRLDGDRIIVELITANADRPVVSGGENRVPSVNTFPITGAQRAVLSRSK